MYMKNKIMKKYSLLRKLTLAGLASFWMLCPEAAKAQEYVDTSAKTDNQELTITASGLLATLDYDIPGTDIKQGQGFALGLEYSYYFSDNFGVSLGAEYQRTGATSKTEMLSGAYNTTDFEQEDFEFRYTMTDIEEEQKVGFVNIPLLFTYQNNEYGFYIKAGGKIGLPVMGKYSASYGLSTSGYYEQYNAELFDPAFMGFGNLGRLNSSGDAIDTKPSYIATIEFGVKQPFGIGNIYAGLFFDYGLNDIKETGKHPVIYGTNDQGYDFDSNSVLNSDYADNVKTMAFGIKLRYTFMSF